MSILTTNDHTIPTAGITEPWNQSHYFIRKDDKIKNVFHLSALRKRPKQIYIFPWYFYQVFRFAVFLFCFCSFCFFFKQGAYLSLSSMTDFRQSLIQGNIIDTISNSPTRQPIYIPTVKWVMRRSSGSQAFKFLRQNPTSYHLCNV